PTNHPPRARGIRSAAQPEPPIPDAATIHLLDRDVRADLRSLSKPNAEIVGAHLAAAGLFLDDDPRRALDHARAACPPSVSRDGRRTTRGRPAPESPGSVRCERRSASRPTARSNGPRPS